MLNSKQRAFLKSLSNTIDTILMIGKGGVTDEVVKQAEDALTKRELIKVKVLGTSDKDTAETADEIAKKTNSEIVQVIGSKFILFRINHNEPKIQLPKRYK